MLMMNVRLVIRRRLGMLMKTSRLVVTPRLRDVWHLNYADKVDDGCEKI
jgi:hypothetical protein